MQKKVVTRRRLMRGRYAVVVDIPECRAVSLRLRPVYVFYTEYQTDVTNLGGFRFTRRPPGNLLSLFYFRPYTRIPRRRG